MTLATSDVLPSKGITTRLRILQTTDLHGHVLAYDYHRDAPSRAKGLSRTATLIGEARKVAPLSLLFDSGDFLQGSPLTDRLAGRGTQAQHSSPVITAMNLLQFDAATLGNHDLDFGLDYLAEALSQAQFPIVSANLTLPETLQKYIQRYTILERFDETTASPIKIGVTGCLPRDTLRGSSCINNTVQAAPVAPALELAISEMKALGADVIVVLAHCGLEDATKDSETIHNTIAALKGVDAILGGHTHEAYPSANQSLRKHPSECPVVMAGAWGTHLGQIDLTLQPDQQHWTVVASTAEAISVNTSCPQTPQTPECPDIIRKTASAHEATRTEMRRSVGSTKGQIDSFFALVRNDTGLQLIASAFEAHMRAMISDTQWGKLPVLSAAAPYKTGSRAGPSHFCLIPEGVIAKRDVSALYGFSDTLTAIKLTGAELRAWLELSACVFNQISPSTQDATLLDPAFPGYRFDVIPQLTYEINLAQPARYDADRKLRNSAAHRIENLRYKSAPVQDDDNFIVALNSFRANQPWPDIAPNTPSQPKVIFNSGHRCASVLEGHIRQLTPIKASVRPSWRFSPVKGATALFLTAPEACGNIPKGVSYVQTTVEGFAQMRLSLG